MGSAEWERNMEEVRNPAHLVGLLHPPWRLSLHHILTHEFVTEFSLLGVGSLCPSQASILGLMVESTAGTSKTEENTVRSISVSTVLCSNNGVMPLSHNVLLIC